jgi:hypothetical protein
MGETSSFFQGLRHTFPTACQGLFIFLGTKARAGYLFDNLLLLLNIGHTL